MFLVVSLMLSLLTVWITWKVAYRLADPRAGLSHSKFIGSMAGMAALPTLGASIACANYAVGQGFAVAIAVSTMIGMLIASPVGEQVGLRQKV